MAAANIMEEKRINQDKRPDTLGAHIAEYNSLRSEVLTRLQSQSQSFSYLVTVLAAAVGGITYLLKEGRTDLLPGLGLYLPIVVAPLAYIFFDNELMIFRNGFYISKHLQDSILNITGEKVFMLEDKAFTYLGGFNCKVHSILSYGRWLLFLVPIIGPIIYALSVIREWEAVHLVILIVDFILAIVVGLAAYAVLRVHGIWRGLGSRGAEGGAAL